MTCRYNINSATKCGFVLHVVNLWSARIVLGPESVNQERTAREENPEIARSKPPLGYWESDEKGSLDWSHLFPIESLTGSAWQGHRNEEIRRSNGTMADEDLSRYLSRCLLGAAAVRMAS